MSVSRRLPVAVLGATGAVGQEFIRLLDNGGGAPTPGKNLYPKPDVIRLQRKLDPGVAAAAEAAPAAAVPGTAHGAGLTIHRGGRPCDLHRRCE